MDNVRYVAGIDLGSDNCYRVSAVHSVQYGNGLVNVYVTVMSRRFDNFGDAHKYAASVQKFHDDRAKKAAVWSYDDLLGSPWCDIPAYTLYDVV